MAQTPKITFLDDDNSEFHTAMSSSDFRKIHDRFTESPTIVSISLPMEKAGAETRKNPIVFKNALNEAIEKLETLEGEHRNLLFTLRNLKELDNPTLELWQNQNLGLVLYVDDSDAILGVRLPYTVSSSVEIGEAPHLRPLHRLADPKRYYVLALDLNELVLYEATRWTLNPLELENVPTSLAEAMKYDDPEESLQFRSAAPAQGKGGPAPVYHGHGVTTDATENEKIHRFFEMVSQNVADNFPDRQTDLILLGPASHRSRYRETNHYERLNEHDIDLNPSNRTQEELQEIIGSHIEKLADAELTKELEILESHIAAEKGSKDLATVAVAAITGKVDSLYILADARRYGIIDEETLNVELDSNSDSQNTELVGFCVDRALENGANLRVIESDALRLPGDACLAATFRF